MRERCHPAFYYNKDAAKPLPKEHKVVLDYYIQLLRFPKFHASLYKMVCFTLHNESTFGAARSKVLRISSA